MLESLITMKEQTGERERVCLFCVESCGWCGGEDLCQVVREGLLSEPGSKGDCERILENLGSVLCRMHSKPFRQAHTSRVEAADRHLQQ